jgi:uncharacterized protein
MTRLKGQRALVTGASSGIGRALAVELARLGADLVITARREERLEELAAQLRAEVGVQVHVEPLDLAAPGAAAELVRRVDAAGLQIDLLINNAGLGPHRPFVDTPWDRLHMMLQVNVMALVELTRLLVPAMVSRGRGRVMNVASIGAFLPVPSYAVYGGTKALVRNFTEALDAELKGTGVRAIVVCPGGTRTEFMTVNDEALNRLGDLASMSAERCARIAVRKMLRGRRTVVTGFFNALGMVLLRLVPRRWMPFFGRLVGMAVD